MFAEAGRWLQRNVRPEPHQELAAEALDHFGHDHYQAAMKALEENQASGPAARLINGLKAPELKKAGLESLYRVTGDVSTVLTQVALGCLQGDLKPDGDEQEAMRRSLGEVFQDAGADRVLGLWKTLRPEEGELRAEDYVRRLSEGRTSQAEVFADSRQWFYSPEGKENYAFIRRFVHYFKTHAQDPQSREWCRLTAELLGRLKFLDSANWFMDQVWPALLEGRPLDEGKFLALAYSKAIVDKDPAGKTQDEKIPIAQSFAAHLAADPDPEQQALGVVAKVLMEDQEVPWLRRHGHLRLLLSGQPARGAFKALQDADPVTAAPILNALAEREPLARRQEMLKTIATLAGLDSISRYARGVIFEAGLEDWSRGETREPVEVVRGLLEALPDHPRFEPTFLKALLDRHSVDTKNMSPQVMWEEFERITGATRALLREPAGDQGLEIEVEPDYLIVGDQLIETHYD